MANSKHPHCEVIKAWAEGAEIQVKAPGGDWKDCSSRPSWYEAYDYRVKPEPKPDVRVLWAVAKPRALLPSSIMGKDRDFVKCIYDGGTGELKAVEIFNGER